MTRKEEILSLISEKKELLNEKKRLADMYNAMQLADKLVLNGSYGALANKHFACFCNGVAATITAHGRDLTRFMNDKNEEYWFQIFHNDKELHKSVIQHSKVLDYIKLNNLDIRKILKFNKSSDILYTPEYDKILNSLTFDDSEYPIINKLDDTYVDWKTGNIIENPTKEQIYKNGEAVRKNAVSVYADTDSVDKDTIITTNNGKYTIETLYNNNIKNGSAGITENGHESVICNDKILNFDDTKLYYGNAKRIIRHKVTKEKWLLKSKNGKLVYVTSDHSLIIYRNNQKLKIKPKDVLKGDKILIIIQ